MYYSIEFVGDNNTTMFLDDVPEEVFNTIVTDWQEGRAVSRGFYPNGKGSYTIDFNQFHSAEFTARERRNYDDII